MWRHVAANALTFFVVALFLVAGLVTWGINEYSDEGPLAEAICFRVEGGSTMRQVSEQLGDQGAISSPTIFRLGADYTERNEDLKQGSFLIPAKASMEEITDLVTRPGASTCGTEVVYVVGVNATQARVRALDPATATFEETVAFDPRADAPLPPEYEAVRQEPDTTYRVVVAEGVTSWQVVQALNALDVLDGEVSTIPAEGRLAPQDYPIAPGTTVQTLLTQMEQAQAAILAEAWENRARDLPFDTPEEALTLASIVEKETGVAAERPRVAAVFVNRLKRGMPLQSDPTVIYALTGGKAASVANGEGILGRGLTRADLQADHPYNTYRNPGLPPGPIANPGRASIEAVLNPPATNELYFVADGTGGHAFAATLEEHNRNVAKWRKLQNGAQ
jgi:UPF0755 protein